MREQDCRTLSALPGNTAVASVCGIRPLSRRCLVTNGEFLDQAQVNFFG